jgi:hypothetical protein
MPTSAKSETPNPNFSQVDKVLPLSGARYPVSGEVGDALLGAEDIED